MTRSPSPSSKVVLYLVICLVGLVATVYLLRSGGQSIGSAISGLIGGEAFDTAGIVEDIVTGIEALDNLVLAEYNGVVFLRETFPARFLGVEVYDVDIWKQIPGVVRASIDLTTWDIASHVHFSNANILVELPEPDVDTCELLLDEVQEGVSYSFLPFESAESIAEIEETMYLSAQLELVSNGLDAGLLERAQDELRTIVTMLVLELGYTIQVDLSFLEGGYSNAGPHTLSGPLP